MPTLHNSLTANELHFSKIETISGPPSSAPTYIGQTLYDTLNNVFYISINTILPSDWIAQSGAGSSAINVQEGTSYTVQNSDNGAIIRMTNVLARTVTMLATPPNGFKVTIEDGAAGGGTAYTANITIGGNGAYFDNENALTTSYVISSNLGSVTFVYDTSTTTWVIQDWYAGGQPQFFRVRNINNGPLYIQNDNGSIIALNIGGTNVGVISNVSANFTRPILLTDSTDNTKEAKFVVNNATTNTLTTVNFAQTSNIIVTMPNATDTIVARNTTDLLTNKSVNNLNFNNPGNTFYTNVVGGNNSSNLTLTLPITAPVASQVLASSDSSGTLEWLSSYTNTSQTYDVVGATLTFPSNTSLVNITGTDAVGPIQGITAGTNGQLLTIFNSNTNSITIVNGYAGAPLAQKVSFPFAFNFTLLPFTAVTFIYYDEWFYMTPDTAAGLIGSTGTTPSQGCLGELVSDNAANVSTPSGGNWGSIKTISLTAGVWDVTGVLVENSGVNATIAMNVGITTSSSTSPPSGAVSAINTIYGNSLLANNTTLSLPAVRIIVNSTTPCYLNCSTSAVVSVTCRISAVRVG